VCVVTPSAPTSDGGSDALGQPAEQRFDMSSIWLQGFHLLKFSATCKGNVAEAGLRAVGLDFSAIVS
jgi:hypothetical protein